MNYEELSGSWNYPTAVRVGAGTIRELPGLCHGLGIKRPLLVTDPGLATSDMLEQVVLRARKEALELLIFSQVKGNPTGDNVEAGVAAYRSGGHDGVIAFGGGSAIDAAKTIAMMTGQSGHLWDYEDVDDNWQRVDGAAIAPLLAVATTAGTGSEVGRAALITDEQRRMKKIIFHPRLLPKQVILDPELTVGLPPSLTAATGMDALSHNLEALCSPVWHPMAEGIAIEGIRLVSEFLPRAVADGQDMAARAQMIVASTMGATAFQKGLGAMHALAHPLGALYDAHHGLLNAILMPYVLQTNRAEVTDRLERAARYLALPQPGFDSFMTWVLELRDQIGIPENLAAIGIGLEEAQLVGEMALADPTAATNPVALSAEGYSELFRRAVTGEPGF